MEVFDLTYKDQLQELAEINLADRARALELEMRSESLIIPFLGRQHFISRQGVIDSDGKAPTPAVATVLLNYTLRNAGIPQANAEKVSFRDFKGAGPLVVSFANNTNHLIASTFAGRLNDLEAACRDLGGVTEVDAVSSDLFMKFQALPGVPQYLIFNDRDDVFPADSHLLFQRSAESYLNLKSLFVLGTFLAGSLINF
ncbi:MAG: DUF3786 domain-containing protein [Desulfobacteraceae bacterium]|jgi:hypothetical protein|nr:DUF3786 domain-containing protein [Desulfobacteraceae bacterium]